MADLREEIEKRRTFAIISHPDAGKTTLTEKFLLYGGAINLGGSVKEKRQQDMLFPTDGDRKRERYSEHPRYCSLTMTDTYQYIDTPTSGFLGGHLSYTDGSGFRGNGHRCIQGVEAQTRKLFKVCVMRHIPIFTFINKMTVIVNDTFELLDDNKKRAENRDLSDQLADRFPEKILAGMSTATPKKVMTFLIP